MRGRDDIFESNEKTQLLPSRKILQNSAFENKNMYSIERVQEIVNVCKKQKSLESETRERKKLNSKLTDSESEISSEKSFLPGVKSMILSNTQLGAENKSKFIGKTLLTTDKLMTHRPHKRKGRDDVFESNEKTLNLPSQKVFPNSAFMNKEMNSIKRVQEILSDCRKQNSLESQTRERKILNSKLTDSESEMSSEESFLPGVKSMILSKTQLGVENKSKSFGKTLLTTAKPMTYRPRKMRGRDEGYVERQKHIDLFPKRKRNRSRKLKYFPNVVQNFDLSITISKFFSTPEESEILLNNEQIIQLSKEKDIPKTNNANIIRSISKNRQFGENVLTDPKSLHFCSSDFRNKNEIGTKTMKSSNLFTKIKNGKIKQNSELNQEINVADLSKQLSEKPQKPSEKNIASDGLKNKSLSISATIKDSGKSTFSFKIIPKNLRSQMTFSTNKNTSMPVRGKQHSKKTTFTKYVPDNRKTYVPENKLSVTDMKQKNTQEKIIVSENESRVNRVERKHFDDKRCNLSHTLLATKSKDNLHNNIRHPSTDTSISTSMVIEYNKLLSELSSFSMVKYLIKLKTVWLQQQCKNPHPPVEVTQGVVPLHLNFKSYESYVSSFYPLLLLEIWQLMFEESKEVMLNKKTCKRFNFRVINFIYIADCIELNCESVVNEKYHCEPREGMITVLEMNSQHNYTLFGYILKHKVDPLNLDLLHPCWKKTSAEYFNDAKLWTFSVWIKKKDLLPEQNILMGGIGICYIRNRLRLVDSLKCLKNSPLLTDILKPRLSTFTLNCSKFCSEREYSSHQKEIIEAVSSELHKQNHESKITLIHGPPGTGKTHVILGILESLFYGSKYNSNLKVLVTAPSNIAIDEIGCRLIELNERYGWRDYSIKFVRVGVEKQIHSKMLPYFIDRKASELYKKDIQLSKQNNKDLQLLSSKILNLENEPDSLHKTDMLKKLKEQYKSIDDRFLLKYVHSSVQIKYKCDILKESHIVLTTLSNCNLFLLSKTFLPTSEFDLNFSCCIVDESTQCTELEILQPLALGISKLILFGDEEQLPSTHSKYCKKYGYDRSMFERFCLYFHSTNKPSPVLSLTEQFRMHPSICEFPSKYTYNEKLSTNPVINLRYQDFPLKPYFIVDIVQHSETLSETIKDCEVLAYNVCKFVKNSVDPSNSVGVILPHESQRHICSKFLHSHSQFKDVEISTVNGFQGKEKDIIILCAVDTKSHCPVDSFITCNRKLNVALTRAKKCLIICLNSSILMEYPHWKALIKNGKDDRKIFYSVTSPREVSSVLQYAKQ